MPKISTAIGSAAPNVIESAVATKRNAEHEIPIAAAASRRGIARADLV
jgi:hypothetical protein